MKKKEKVEGFFDTEVLPNQGMNYGRNKNLNEINEYVKPLLNKNGFECTPIVGEEEARKNFPIGQYEIWSSLGKRLERGGSGNLHKIFSITSPSHSITAQIFVLDNASATELGKMAKFDHPASIVNETTEENRIPYTLELLKGTGVYMFLYVRPDYFVLIGYWEVPIKGWKLSYRGNKFRKNRMRINTNYMLGTYVHIKELKDVLTKKLHMKYENR